MAKTGKVQLTSSGKRLILPSGKAGVLINEDDCCPCEDINLCCDTIGGPATSVAISGMTTDYAWVNGTWAVEEVDPALLPCRSYGEYEYTDSVIRTFTLDGYDATAYKVALFIQVNLDAEIGESTNSIQIIARNDYKFVKDGVTTWLRNIDQNLGQISQPCALFDFSQSRGNLYIQIAITPELRFSSSTVDVTVSN